MQKVAIQESITVLTWQVILFKPVTRAKEQGLKRFQLMGRNIIPLDQLIEDRKSLTEGQPSINNWRVSTVQAALELTWGTSQAKGSGARLYAKVEYSLCSEVSETCRISWKGYTATL